MAEASDFAAVAIADIPALFVVGGQCTHAYWLEGCFTVFGHEGNRLSLSFLFSFGDSSQDLVRSLGLCYFGEIASFLGLSLHSSKVFIFPKYWQAIKNNSSY